MTVAICVAKFTHFGELLTAEGPAPHRPNCRLVLGQVVEHLEHGLAHRRTHAEDAFKFIGGCAIDGEPSIFAIHYLDEGVRRFHHVGQQQSTFLKVFGEQVLPELIG